MTWPDLGFLLIVVAFAARGFFRGLVQEILTISGWIGGWWAAGWIAGWVGTHWQGAQPALMFWVGKWVVIIAAGLACAALFRWWGRKLFEAMRGTWLGRVDRGAGVIMGTALGAVIATFVLLGALLAPWPSHVTAFAADSRLAIPLMNGGAETCRRVGDSFPGSTGLRRHFLAALARIEPSGPSA